MSRSQYPYPPDEFDARSPGDAPVGVHRAPRGRWSSVWPFLLVAVVAVGLAVGGVWYMSRDNAPTDNVADGGTTATAPVEGETTETPAGDDTETPAEGDDAQGGEETPDATETEPEAETPAAADLTALLAAANLDANVRVLNGSGINGEAGRGQEALTAHGFTQVEAETYTGGDTPADTTVWYTAGHEDTAAAVAAALGIPAANVSEQPLRSGDVAVIIRAALTPAG